MILYRNMLCYFVLIFQRERRFNQRENFDKVVRFSDICSFYLQLFSFNLLEFEFDFDGVIVRYVICMLKRENVLESEGLFFFEEVEVV